MFIFVVTVKAFAALIRRVVIDENPVIFFIDAVTRRAFDEIRFFIQAGGFVRFVEVVNDVLAKF